jgi:hypothetical protein
MRLRAFAHAFVVGLLASWTNAHAGFLTTNYPGASFKTGGNNTAIGTNNPSVGFMDGKTANKYILTIGPNPPTALPGLTNLLTTTFTGPDSLGHSFGSKIDLFSTPFSGRGNELTVKSYAAFSNGGGGLVGVSMYVSYAQNGGNDPKAGSVQWIQVITDNWALVNGSSQPGVKATQIDVSPSATSPFYNDSFDANKGGSTYLYDEPSRLASKLATYSGSYPLSFTFQTFAVVDTGLLDTNNKDIVNVYGGFQWGFSVVPEPSSIVLVLIGAVVLVAGKWCHRLFPPDKGRRWGHT